jgi:hypothetical protein
VTTGRDDDLDRLIKALTRDGSPQELANRDAARTAFRVASRGADGGTLLDGGTARHRHSRRRRRAFPRVRMRLAVAVACALLAVTASATAAYRQALPAPVQGIAHSMLAPLGVPDRKRDHDHGAQPDTTLRFSLTTSATSVPAGSAVVFTGLVADHGQAAADDRIRLLERIAGTTRWQTAALAVTSPDGTFRLASPSLAKTAEFRAVLDDGRHSATIKVPVAGPDVTAPATASPAPAPTGQ